MSDRAALQALQRLLSLSDTTQPSFGWKVALNVRAVQQRLGLTHSLAAPLSGTRYAHGSRARFAQDSQIHVEAELGLTLACDIREPLPLEELRAAVASYRPCLELVDYALPRGDLAAMFGHAFFHAGVVLGEPLAPAALASFRPPLPRLTSTQGGMCERVVGTVPDDVVLALQGVVERVLEAGGWLTSGQLVLCGSYVDPLPLPPGATVSADYGSASLVLSREA